MDFLRHRAWIARDFACGHRLYICKDTGKRHPSGGGQTVLVATDFVWNEHREGDATFQSEGIPFADDLIQSIMDRAWDEGFRPRGHSDVKNETAALREHLADMKTIAFHQLKITGR